MHNVLNEDVVPVRKLRADVPLDLATVCEKCLSRDQSSRIQSAANLRDELDRFLAGQPVHSRPVSAFERTRKWIHRKPWRAAAMGVAVVSLVCVAVAWLLWQNDTARQHDHALANYEQARETIWKVLNVGDSASVFEIPQLNEMLRAQIENAMPLFENLAENEQTPEASTIWFKLGCCSARCWREQESLNWRLHSSRQRTVLLVSWRTNMQPRPAWIC